jgi:hypothetical protein
LALELRTPYGTAVVDWKAGLVMVIIENALNLED